MNGQNNTSSFQSKAEDYGKKAAPYLARLEQWLDDNLGKKTPQIPLRGREIIVTILPWLTLVALIFSLPLLLNLLGINFFWLPFAFGGVGSYFISGIFMTAAFTLQLIAVRGLFKQSRRSWVLLFYSVLVVAAMNILGVNLTGLLGNLIGLYILFQVRSHYR